MERKEKVILSPPRGLGAIIATKIKFTKYISISNKVTPETLTRISIMKLLAKRYRDSNPGSRVKVVGYDARPLLKIIPAPSASDRRQKVYNFVQAVSKLPTNIPASELEAILRRINPELCGRIRSTFIILSDDAFKKILRARKSNVPGSQHGERRESGASEASVESHGSVGSVDQSTSGSSSSRPAQKRGASSPADGSAAKK